MEDRGPHPSPRPYWKNISRKDCRLPHRNKIRRERLERLPGSLAHIEPDEDRDQRPCEKCCRQHGPDGLPRVFEVFAHGPKTASDSEEKTGEQEPSLNDGDPVGRKGGKMLLSQPEQVPVEPHGIGKNIYNITIVDHDRRQAEGDPGEDTGGDQH